MAPSFVSYQGLVISILVMSIVGTLLLLALVVARAVRRRREAIAAQRLAPLRPLLLEIASGEDDDEAAARELAVVGDQDRPLVVSAALRMLAKVKGEPATALARVLGSLGVTERIDADLRSRSEVRRAAAAWDAGLLRLTDRVPDLIGLLDDKSSTVRLTAVRALGRLGDATAAPGVLASAADRGRYSAVSAPVVIESLVGLGRDAADTIDGGLVAPDPRTRLVAAQAVGNGQLTSLASQLHAALGVETSDEVRVAQLWAIGQVGLPPDAARLSGYLGPEHPRIVRLAAVDALETIGDPGSVAALVGLLADPDRRVAGRAADALSDLGDEGVAALRRASASDGAAGRAAAGALDRYELRAGVDGARR